MTFYRSGQDKLAGSLEPLPLQNLSGNVSESVSEDWFYLIDNEQFARRARGGKCVMQPCFGCREFPAYFRYVEADEPPASPEPINMDLDWMVYDVFDLSLSNRILCTGRHDKKSPNFARFIEKPSISVFHAVVVNGVLTVPDYEDTAVRKLTSVERGTDSCQYQN